MYDIRMIDGEQATRLRQGYVSRFVKQDSQYFRSRIERLQRHADGYYYDGYLWDCLQRPELIRQDAFFEELSHHNAVYVMSDLHSNNKVRVDDYWSFPKCNVLVTQVTSLPALLPLLPDDLYVFDESLNWSLVVTHEIYEDGSTIFYRAT